jgi:hypothetical protein
VAVTPLFYGHDPTCKDYKDAAKIKTLDVHPVHPWIVTADEVSTWFDAAAAVCAQPAAAGSCRCDCPRAMQRANVLVYIWDGS